MKMHEICFEKYFSFEIFAIFPGFSLKNIFKWKSLKIFRKINFDMKMLEVFVEKYFLTKSPENFLEK